MCENGPNNPHPIHPLHPLHPTDTVGPESVPTASHADERLEQHILAVPTYSIAQ